MDQLTLPKPDINRLMTLMPNFEDFEDLVIRRLDCGGRGTVSAWGMVLTLMTLMITLLKPMMTLMNDDTDDDNQVLGPTVCIAGSRVVTAHGNTVRRWDFWKYQVVVMMVIMVMVMVI